MNKETVVELIKKAAREREQAKENFHKLDGMIIAYENILRELEAPGGS